MAVTMQNKIGAVMLVAAYLLLIPGVSLPVIHVTSILDKGVLAEMGKETFMTSQDIPPFMMQLVAGFIDNIQISGTEVIQKTSNSIIGTAETLWHDGNLLVAVLIILFSVVIPVLKGSLLAVAGVFVKPVQPGQSAQESRVSKVANALSKWSMADVFVIALVISFLGANANTSVSELIQTKAEFGEGFYFFLGYCILSITSAQLMKRTG